MPTPTATPSATDLAMLPDAIKEMGKALTHAIYDMGPSLTCSEADSLARVLALAGHLDDAGHVLIGHAAGDDEGDSHHALVTHDDGVAPVAERVKLYVSEDVLGHEGHQHVPDDSPGDDDRCKTCGRFLTWMGPSHLDWALAEV